MGTDLANATRLISEFMNRRDHYYLEYEYEWLTKCNCGLRCKRTDYSMGVSYSAIPDQSITIDPLFRNFGVNATYVKENYASIVLFSRQPFFEQHNQSQALSRAQVLGERWDICAQSQARSAATWACSWACRA